MGGGRENSLIKDAGHRRCMSLAVNGMIMQERGDKS